MFIFPLGPQPQLLARDETSWGLRHEEAPTPARSCRAAHLAGSEPGRLRRQRGAQADPVALGDAAGMPARGEAVDVRRVAADVARAVPGQALELVGVDA